MAESSLSALISLDGVSGEGSGLQRGVGGVGGGWVGGGCGWGEEVALSAEWTGRRFHRMTVARGAVTFRSTLVYLVTTSLLPMDAME